MSTRKLIAVFLPSQNGWFFLDFASEPCYAYYIISDPSTLWDAHSQKDYRFGLRAVNESAQSDAAAGCTLRQSGQDDLVRVSVRAYHRGRHPVRGVARLA
jgi:hypothetical protein